MDGWLRRRQAKLLDNAYGAAQTIKSLENQYGGGQPVTDPVSLGQTVYDYVRGLCDRERLTIRDNLAQFRVNSFLLGRPSAPVGASADLSQAPLDPQAIHPAASEVVIEKLAFIESVIRSYRALPSLDVADPAPRPAKPPRALPLSPDPQPRQNRADNSANGKAIDPVLEQVEITATELARPGLLGSFSRNRAQTAEYEKRVVQELRQRQEQSRVALRWLAILLLVPILVALLTKNLLFGPMLGSYSDHNPTAVELSQEIREEFATNLTQFKEELEIRELLKLVPELDLQAKQEQIADKASELWQEARNEELNGLKNVLSDGTATVAFMGLVYFNRRRLTVVRNFSNRAFLSLSDPMRIFLFILVTDMFVGFHSAEGWDAILTGLSHHFGLPERPNAIKIFIATVPVMMDSCIKFWIFSYLTRFSPSSSAIFERMNT